MVEPTSEFIGGSFHNTIVQATLIDIIIALGKPWAENNDGKDKSNFDWNAKTDCGIGFTVYDWKYYRPLDMNEIVDWHIGGECRDQTEIAASKLKKTIEKKKAESLGLSQDEYDAFVEIGGN
jgi:hypothetical protein